MSDWRYVRWPKTASSTVATWWQQRGMAPPMGHAGALEVRAAHPDARLLVTARHPLRWYQSWFAHCLRAGPHNHRVQGMLRWWLQRDEVVTVEQWPEMLAALCEGYSVHTHGLPPVAHDHLLAPGGLLPRTPFWSAAAWYYLSGRFGDHGVPWGVDAVVWTGRLEQGLAEVLGYSEPPKLPAMNTGGMLRVAIDEMTTPEHWEMADAELSHWPDGLAALLRGQAGAVWWPNGRLGLDAGGEER